ncbi:MAG: hypothetical protein IJM30_09495 [Thermoguttaceae bacterium]|nr:hypothetical protein [Thermoguttaceae bacterium]
MKLTGRLRLLCAGLVCAVCLGIGYLFKGTTDAIREGDRRPAPITYFPSTGSAPSAPDVHDFGKLWSDTFTYDSAPAEIGTLTFDYAARFDSDPILSSDESVLRAKALVCEGRYDEAIEEVQGELGAWNDLFQDDGNAGICRLRLRLLAAALELKGDWEKALRVYSLLYPDDRELLSWVRIRKTYASGDWTAAFDQLVDVVEQYLDYPAEGIIKEFVQRYNDPRTKERALDDIKENPRYLRVYRLLDQCLQVTNPKFHFNEWDEQTSETRFVEPNREARAAFKEFIETEYWKFKFGGREQAPNLGEQRQTNEAFFFLRKVVNLP